MQLPALMSDMARKARRRLGGVAHIMRDELHDMYEGCGFDAACNYAP